jgi:ribonuclease HII
VLCGVDEAGKGAVLGPLVVAGVVWDGKTNDACPGYRDSKLLSPARREELFADIISRFPTKTIIISAHDIDIARTRMSMNTLIARAHAEVISSLKPECAYVDACDVNPIRYRDTVRAYLIEECSIVSEHHADSKYPLVSAASIVAKVTRDEAMRNLAADFGDIGSGYPSDPATNTFLKDYIKVHRCPPSCSRWSWQTVKGIIAECEQARLPF